MGSAARDREDEDATTQFSNGRRCRHGAQSGARASSSTGRAKSRRKGADAKDTDADLSVVVIGTDGSDLLDDVVDKYLAAHADVWHFMPNLAKFSQVLEFIDKNRKIVLAKTCGDILAAKRAGKVAMVVGWQDSAGLTDGNGNDWRSSNPPKTKLRDTTSSGCAPRTSPISFRTSSAAACSTRQSL